MSDTTKQPESPETGAPPAQAPAVSQDEFKQFQTSTLNALTEMTESLKALASSRNANPGGITSAPQPTVKASDIDAMISEGKPVGDIVKKLIDEGVNAAVKAHVDPIRTVGLDTVANLSLEVVKPKMPYFDRFKKDIDGYLRNLPAEARMNPQVIKTAYDAVVGANASTLIEEEKQKALRASREAPPSQTPSGTSKTGGSGDGSLPSFEEVFGAEAVAALRAKGQSADAFAQRMGYKDAADYVKFTIEQREGATAHA